MARSVDRSGLEEAAPEVAVIPLTVRALSLLAGIAILVAGCGGSRLAIEPLIRDFDRTEQEVRNIEPEAPAPEAWQTAHDHRTAADRLLENGKKDDAYPMMAQAVADLRVALAAAAEARSEADADECRRAVEEARQRWEEMIILLEQTERIARRSAPEITRDPPVMEEGPALPAADAVGTAPPLLDPAALEAAWGAWTDEAAARAVPTADLAARFDASIAVAAGREGDKKDRPMHAYLAGRTLQELQARVRGRAADDVCAKGAVLAARFGNERDAGLRASLELERGMRDDMRAELEKVREEARSRQQQIYEAMRSLEGKYARISQSARGTIVSLADILFDFDKATLKRNVEFSLVKVATILNQFPEMKISVEGHTDNVGKPEYNLELSKRRAQAVHDFLVSQEVASDRMTVAGFGMTRPVADNGTDEGRQKNRRVDLVIQEQP
jgi:outer membrane protein OmpA-like peptidoglycan-associated protein